ncbi:hypothetical protein ID866_9608 [Astraeus odoratus]|nr:hypothetical protein ID866_9608 [Astraeus odoratus]
MSSDPQSQPAPVAPVQVLYCQSTSLPSRPSALPLIPGAAVCGFPTEYCKFGSSLTRCKGWLKETHPALYEKYYSDEALHSKLGNLSIEQQTKLEKSTAEKAEKKADAALKKSASQVSIKRIERNKRKCVTAIHGLEAFDVDLKQAARLLTQKYATGASVAKNSQGQDEIVVQGDVSEEVLELMQGGKGVFAGVPAANVEIVEEKKKGAGLADKDE